jgi:hypothetical protein
MTTVTAVRRTKSKPKAAPKTPSGSALPLGKQLAHTGTPCFPFPATKTDLLLADKKVRDAAFANVIDFLSNGGITQLLAPIEDAGGVIPRSGEDESQDVRRGQLPPVEMRRLWKGLFYCTPPFFVVWPAADL